MRRTSYGLPAAFLLLGSLGAQAAEPRTVPEATAFAETSRTADVQRFVDACVGLSHGDRLTVRVAGKTERVRPTNVPGSWPTADDALDHRISLPAYARNGVGATQFAT